MGTIRDTGTQGTGTGHRAARFKPRTGCMAAEARRADDWCLDRQLRVLKLTAMWLSPLSQDNNHLGNGSSAFQSQVTSPSPPPHILHQLDYDSYRSHETQSTNAVALTRPT